VQLAAASGATVVATGKPGHEGRLRDLGAGHVVDYVSGDVAATVAGLEPAGVAALIDLANDRDGVTGMSRVVRDGGRVASACFGAAAEALAPRGISCRNVVTTHADDTALTRLVDLIDAGSLRVAYDELRPLDEVPAVVEEIGSGPSRKTVIDVALKAS
jgi:NADPH:quinone reductase-like Zn-dependent oxidoreductase